MENNLRIAGYCRISLDDEMDRDNVSVENQKAIIKDFVKQKFPGSTLTFYEDRDRSGYTFEQLSGGTQAQRDLLSQLDVLIDGPFVLAERSLELNFRGSRNQRVLNVPESLKAGHAVEETSGRWLGTY